MWLQFFFMFPRLSTSEEKSNRLISEQAIIYNLLVSKKSNYDWRVRPRGDLLLTGDEGPVHVTVNMYLRSISKVDDVNMEYNLHFTFREEWVDERLLFYSDSLSHIVLSPEQRIWMPDTFFQNEKRGKKHKVDTPNIMIRVYNATAKILYSSRMTLTLSCPMRLHDYPLDIQRCHIDYASYAYTDKDIVYHWKEDEPIQIKDGLKESLPSFVLSDVRIGNCTSITNTGTYSCLRTIIELKREFSFYLLQLYIPSFMLVAVSWVSFWLDKDSVPARVTLGVTTLLTITTQASGISASLPPVSYTKAIDIWIGVCTAFIFAALIEFALVNWAARKEIEKPSWNFRRKRPKPRNIYVPPNELDLCTYSVPVDIWDDQEKQCEPSLISAYGMPPYFNRSLWTTADSVSKPSMLTRRQSTRKWLAEHGLQTTSFSPIHAYHEKTFDIRRPSPFNFSSAPMGQTSPIFWSESGGETWHIDDATTSIRPHGGSTWWCNYRQRSRQIDHISRVVFPVTFILFNLTYWWRYLRPYLAVKENL
ncbi:hypothetical protein AB6A40_000505 [Gnathostoma spinigerum]|uniref:Ig-like domain-containing protein n=1 Tax=Gnathostoma spinigerum TaxID=75299 RepID=A0ABD6E8W6_9BILA